MKALKDERKVLAGEVKEAKRLTKTEHRRASTLTRSASEAHTARASLALRVGISSTATAEERIQTIDQQLERHAALDAELKKLKANIREVEKQKDEMIAAARAKITEDEAKTLILERFRNLLTEQFDGYLRQYQRSSIAAVENLWQKYAVTTKQILAERDREAAQLDAFLTELGYNL